MSWYKVYWLKSIHFNLYCQFYRRKWSDSIFLLYMLLQKSEIMVFVAVIDRLHQFIAFTLEVRGEQRIEMVRLMQRSKSKVKTLTRVEKNRGGVKRKKRVICQRMNHVQGLRWLLCRQSSKNKRARIGWDRLKRMMEVRTVHPERLEGEREEIRLGQPLSWRRGRRRDRGFVFSEQNQRR